MWHLQQVLFYWQLSFLLVLLQRTQKVVWNPKMFGRWKKRDLDLHVEQDTPSGGLIDVVSRMNANAVYNFHTSERKFLRFIEYRDTTVNIYGMILISFFSRPGTCECL